MPAPRTMLSALALMLVVSGCEKPTPAVTLQADGDVVRTESAVFCETAADLEAQKCAEHPDRVEVLRVSPGSMVSIDVDKALTKKGWYVVDADAKQRSGVQDEHYFTLTPDFSNRPTAGIINLEVRSLDRVADDARVLGVWKFQLVQK